MWELYDDLIQAIPPDLRVEKCIAALGWVLVRSRTTGLSLVPFEHGVETPLSGTIAGMPVRELATYIKSWNPLEASFGMAAVNSVFNTQDNLVALSGKTLEEQSKLSAFDYFKDRLAGKKVAVIGHFPGMEGLASVSQLTVLERRPHPGDLPDAAAEYVLPHQDAVFITASSIINKTLPRLLDLSRQAFTVVVGPSTTLSPVFFRYGVDAIGGTIAADEQVLWQVVQEGSHKTIFQRGGHFFKLTREEYVARS